MKYFVKEYDHIERWKNLRQDLFRNEEPSVKLVAVTTPVPDAGLITPETLPGYTARQSHESSGDYHDDLRLGKKLISMGHDTPLEALQFVLHVSGISKSLAGQWTRHRAGIGWTFRSTRYVSAAGNTFVYPAFEYINDESLVRTILSRYEEAHWQALETYDLIKGMGAKNQELRRLMPVGWASAAYVYVNARALRHFFKLRLDPHAEWEIRRLAILTINRIMDVAPSLFEDLVK